MAEVNENMNHKQRWDAGAGTTALGIIGTSLVGLATVLAGGNAAGQAAGNFQNQPVCQHDLGYVQEIGKLQSELDKEKSERYADGVGLRIYEYFNGKISSMKEEQNAKWTAQEVVNANFQSAVAVLKQQVETSASLLASITRTAIPQSAICNFNSGCNTGCCGTSVN